MSLLLCPECRHEVSSEAVACPNCGRPLTAPTPVITRKVVVAEPVDDGFPTWIIAPLVALAALVVFLLFVVTRGPSDEAANARSINVNLERPAAVSRERVASPASNPATSAPVAVSTPPPPTTPTRSTDVAPPAVVATPERGSVQIDARIAAASGDIQPVRAEKFYLLDKPLEEILDDAGLESIDGNSLGESLGMAVMNPNRYADFRTKAMSAISKHVKYSATTGSDGRASMASVAPDDYYLFAVTRTREGYAVWSSPVTVIAGDNKLNLQPARLINAGE